MAVIEVGSVITIVFAVVAFFLGNHPSASMPALLMSAAGLITAFSGLATVIGGQIIPVFGRWFDARREARLAEEARANLSHNLQSAVDRVTELESMVLKNEERVIKNSELMKEIAARGYRDDESRDLASGVHDALRKLDELKAAICTKEECATRNAKVLQIITELEAVVRKNDEKVTINTDVMQQLVEKIVQPKSIQDTSPEDV